MGGGDIGYVTSTIPTVQDIQGHMYDVTIISNDGVKSACANDGDNKRHRKITRAIKRVYVEVNPCRKENEELMLALQGTSNKSKNSTSKNKHGSHAHEKTKSKSNHPSTNDQDKSQELYATAKAQIRIISNIILGN